MADLIKQFFFGITQINYWTITMKLAYVLDGSQLYSSAFDTVFYHSHYSLCWNPMCELHME